MFRKVLIANRGEIALRIIRTLREMDIRTVAVYSDADRAALHVRKADEAAHIGPAPSRESYLDIDRILDAARRHGVDAIHPGYGFLSENARFAQAVVDSGLVFIGPPPRAIELMGSKTEARRIAKRGGAPIVPGTEEGLESPAEALRFARDAGFPVMLKAVAGGGGKGMRRVDREADFASAFAAASSEALRAFGDGRVYVEKLIEHARHVEIQVIGDQHGSMVHLGERECSIQRRHQKVIEESPSPLVARMPGLRDRMGQAAIQAAQAAGYFNAGTVEFLADDSGRFYFLEMNTRLQVEHPVTELVTGLDLVRLQVEIAAGARLPFAQDQVALRGAAIECRIYAEDPANNFFPSPGRITQLNEPAGPGVRLDSGIYPGWTVPLEYDPMLSKLIVWADRRDRAIDRMRRALSEYHVGGIRTNIAFFQAILRDPGFRAGNIHTNWLDERLRAGIPPGAAASPEIAALVASRQIASEPSKPAAANESRWLAAGREDLIRGAGNHACKPAFSRLDPLESGSAARNGCPTPVTRVIRINGMPVLPADADIVETEPGVWSVLLEGTSYEARVSGREIVVNERSFAFDIEDPRAWKRAENSAAAQGRASILAPMPGKVVRILVAQGDPVEAGQGIVVVEAMKMQNEMKSPRAGVVVSIPVRENDSVNSGALLAMIE